MRWEHQARGTVPDTRREPSHGDRCCLPLHRKKRPRLTLARQKYRSYSYVQKKSPFGVRKTWEGRDYGPNLLPTLIYFSAAILWRTYKKGGHSSTINALTLKVLFKISTPKWPLKVIPKPLPSQPSNLPRHHTVTHASIQQGSAGIWIYNVCQPLTTAKLYCFSDLYLCKSTVIHV